MRLYHCVLLLGVDHLYSSADIVVSEMATRVCVGALWWLVMVELAIPVRVLVVAKK